MKKIAFAFLLTVSFMTTCAQEVYHAYESGIATFSEEFKRWVYDTPQPSDLTFILDRGVITVNDRKGSAYILGKEFQNENKPDRGDLGWDAVDEDGTKCAVKLIFYREIPIRIQIACIYGSSCYYFNTHRVNR